MMRLAKNIICFAVRSQPGDLDDECDPRERWIGEADKLKRMSTVWFEQDVGDEYAKPRDGDGDAAERSEVLVHPRKNEEG
jgi:hypothetical protein